MSKWKIGDRIYGAQQVTNKKIRGTIVAHSFPMVDVLDDASGYTITIRPIGRLVRGDPKSREIIRLKVRINSLLDAISENANRATQQRIYAAANKLAEEVGMLKISAFTGAKWTDVTSEAMKAAQDAAK